MVHQCEVGIVGAGPLGLELAIALKRLNIPYVHFDKGQIAQMVYNFPPQTQFFSSTERIAIAGLPLQTLDQQKCSREAYLAYMRQAVLQFDLKINTYEEVVKIGRMPKEEFALETIVAGQNQLYQVRYLVLATGGTSSPRVLGVPGEGLSHVASKMGDPHQYFQKRVLIVGGKNSAAETALRCYHAGAEVSLVVRQKTLSEQSIKYWLLPELKSLIAKRHIACFYQSEVVEIFPDRVVMATNTDTRSEIAVDFVIKAIGFKASLDLCQQTGVHLSEHQTPSFDPATMETNVPNAFILGTVVGGTQKQYAVFIENTHSHVEKICRALAQRLKLSLPASFFPPAFQSKPQALEE